MIRQKEYIDYHTGSKQYQIEFIGVTDRLLSDDEYNKIQNIINLELEKIEIKKILKMKIKETKKVHINMELDYKEVAIELLQKNGKLSNESIVNYVKEKLENFLEIFYIENDVNLDKASTVTIFKDGYIRPKTLDYVLTSSSFKLIRN